MDRISKFILYKPYFNWAMSVIFLVESFWMTYISIANPSTIGWKIFGLAFGLFFAWASFDYASDALKIHARNKCTEEES